jgi:hypothetical protein
VEFYTVMIARRITFRDYNSAYREITTNVYNFVYDWVNTATDSSWHTAVTDWG